MDSIAPAQHTSEKKPTATSPAEDTVKPRDVAPSSTLKNVVLDAAARGQATSGYEELTVWETVKTFKLCAFVCFMVAFSAATDGYQVGINGNLIANKGFVEQFATGLNTSGQRFLESPILSAWSSIMSVGQIVGMVSLPFVSNNFGRKAAMYTFWLIIASSVLCESLARRWQVWLVAKLLAGIGIGCLQTTLPTYIAEVAPVRIRGGLLMCYSFWWTLGTFFAHVALQVMYEENPYSYLIPIYTQWGHVGLMILIYIFVPESPFWCVTRGRTGQAKKELARLYYGVKDFDLEQQYQILVMAVEHERAIAAEQQREKWYAIFRGTDGLRTVISLWTNMAQQFIGLTLFSTFGSYFFEQAGIDDPFLITVITSSINIATLILVISSADRLGRRWMACWGTTLSWTACVAIGIIGVVPSAKATTYLFVLFTCFWNIGLTANGATGWGFIGEISSQRLRPYTAGFAAASTCVAGVVMNVLTPYMVNANEWGWSLKTGWFYAGIGLPFTVGVWFLIPETTGRTAAELDELFESKVKPWRFHKVETATQRIVNLNK